MERAALRKSLYALQESLKNELKRASRRKDWSTRACRFLEREIKYADSIEQHFERDDLEFVVVGITKAGKSTIVNALIGDELLPVSNVPTTAVRIKVRHSDSSLEPRLLEPRLLNGTQAIQQTLHTICIKKRNASRVNNFPVIEACFSSFHGKMLKKGGLRPSLIDTPGVTEASGSHFTRATLKAVDTADFVLLVLNYGYLKTEAERQFLGDLARRRPDFFLRRTNRLLCIVTRMDLRNRNGLSVDKAADYLRDHLSASLDKSVRSYVRVFPLNAELALLGRLAMRGYFDHQDQADDFMRYFYGQQGCKHSPTSDELRRMGAASVKESGLQAIEAALQKAVAKGKEVRNDAIRSRLSHALDRSYQWSMYSNGTTFQTEVASLRTKLLNKPKPSKKWKAR